MDAKATLTCLLLALAPPALAQDAPTREPAQVRPGRYVLDPSHGKITWSLSHMGFSTYAGQFTGVEAELQLDPREPARSTLQAKVNTGNAATHDAALDAHLKTADFLDVDQHPTAIFKATHVEPAGPRAARITGDLTLLGVTRPVTLEATFNQAGVSPIDQRYTAGFDARATLRRSEWGMTKFLPGLGDEVSLALEGEFKLVE